MEGPRLAPRTVRANLVAMPGSNKQDSSEPDPSGCTPNQAQQKARASNSQPSSLHNGSKGCADKDIQRADHGLSNNSCDAPAVALVNKGHTAVEICNRKECDLQDAEREDTGEEGPKMSPFQVCKIPRFPSHDHVLGQHILICCCWLSFSRQMPLASSQHEIDAHV